jgi:hypothetical protein
LVKVVVTTVHQQHQQWVVDSLVMAVVTVVMVEHMVLVEVEVRMEVILEVLVLVVQYALSGQVLSK